MHDLVTYKNKEDKIKSKTRVAVDGTPSQIPTFFTFDLYFGVEVTQNVAQYPLYHVTYMYAPQSLGVARSIGLGDAFTRKYITLHKMLPSTLHIM